MAEGVCLDLVGVVGDCDGVGVDRERFGVDFEAGEGDVPADEDDLLLRCKIFEIMLGIPGRDGYILLSSKSSFNVLSVCSSVYEVSS